MGDLITCFIGISALLIVVFSVVFAVKRRKNNKKGCCGGCSGCSLKDGCSDFKEEQS